MTNHLQKYLFFYLVAISVGNAAIFGIPHNTLWQGGALGSDALGYSQYAHNIATGNGFSMNGTDFSAVREPGYPVFLALIYSFFGVDNVQAVIIFQIIILSLIGYTSYVIVRRFAERYVAVIVALAVCALPYYGYYAAEYMTELLFAFVLFMCVYVSIKLSENQDNHRYQILCGLIFASAALIRAQMLLFPIFYGIFVLVLYRNRFSKTLISIAFMFCAYMVPIIIWSGIVFAHTGNFMITEGRQEMLIHVRAVRSTLSYSELFSYTKEWFVRSLSGGETNSSLVATYDLKAVKNEYKKIAVSEENIQAIKKADIQTIRNNLGHYFFGNVIEYMKLLYIEHDYSGYMNRYLRLANYVFMYGLFFFGMWSIISKRNNISREIHTGIFFSLLIIIYHLIVLTFLETVPRFNTPLHGLYVMIGIIGLFLWKPKFLNK